MKINKKEAYEIVRKMSQYNNNNNKIKDDLSKLLHYFGSTSPKKAKTPLQWVASFVGKNDYHRPALNFICVKGNIIIATNGHALAIIENTNNYKDGLYNYSNNQLLKDDSTILKYPSIKDILSLDEFIKNEDSKYTRKVINEKKSQYVLTDIYDRECLFDAKYIERILYCAKKWHFETKDEDGALTKLKAETEFGKCIVMAIQNGKKGL